jgi:alpha-N-arabinofuranosidase
LNVFNNHCARVKMANLAQTVNVLQSLVLTDKEKMLLTPTYYVFDLYKVHQDANLLSVQFTSPDYVYGDEKVAAVNLSASRDAKGAVHISLVNINPAKAITIHASIPGINYKNVLGQILTSQKFTDVNTFEKPYTVRIEPFTGAKKQGDELVVELPAQSVVLIELK